MNYYVATVESINGTEVTVKAEGKLYTFDFYGSDLEVGDSITIGVPNNHEIFTYF